MDPAAGETRSNKAPTDACDLPAEGRNVQVRLSRGSAPLVGLACCALLWILLVSGDVWGRGLPQTPDVQLASGVSVSIELSPGPHLPRDQTLTGVVTVDGLDHNSYSSVVFRADIVGHEDNTSTCYGEDTGQYMDVGVDASSESFDIEVFKPCDPPGGFGTYDYILDLGVWRDGQVPSSSNALASARVRFLVSSHLQIGETWGPAPEPTAAAWMDPDPSTVDWVVHGEWRHFRIRSNLLLYGRDNLFIVASTSVVGHFSTFGPDLSPEEACTDEYRIDLSWRVAVHQRMWIVACQPGEATIDLLHETDSVAPLYSYQVTTHAWTPSDGVSTVEEDPSSGTAGGGGGTGGGGTGGGGTDIEQAKASEVFTDIDPGVSYEPAVTWMILHDITRGCAPALFCPLANLARQRFVTFLWRAAGEPTPRNLGSEVFADVMEGGYADQAIGWAASSGITVGCTEGRLGDPDWHFCPSQLVTRGQMATLLYRHVEADYIGTTTPYTDVEPDRFYATGIAWLTDFEVVPGCNAVLFCPNRSATRAEAALFINGTAIRPHIWGEGNTRLMPQPN